MKLFLIAVSMFLIQVCTNAQALVADYFKTALPLKATKLIRKDNVYQFSSEKWQAVTNKDLWPDLFGVENEKMWTGQKVNAIRLAGWWKISSKTFGYIYAADLETGEGKFVPSIFVSSFNIETNRKGIDVDPFSQAPSPTGMRGKVVVTQTVQVSGIGIFTLINKHQTPAKLLSKTVKYSIGEDGAVEEVK